LVAWVEEGKLPQTIIAKGPPNAKGDVARRPLCTCPLVARYVGTGDENDPSSFNCAEEYLSATPMKLVVRRVRKYFGFGGSTKDEL
jgi:hypothetical protein